MAGDAALAFAPLVQELRLLALIKIVVADDHPLVRAGVCRVLQDDAGIRVVGEAESADALFRFLHSRRCDVVLADLHMPVGEHADGVPMLQVLCQRWPSLPVVAFTMVDNLAVLQLAVSAGLRGVLLKTEPLAALSVAIRRVHADGTYFSAALQDKWMLSERQAKAVPTTPLSPREYEVFCLFVRGMSVSQIALKLQRSIKTVSRQKRSAMAKLRLAHDVEAYDYARVQGLLG